MRVPSQSLYGFITRVSPQSSPLIGSMSPRPKPAFANGVRLVSSASFSHREVRINDIVGDGISGVLQKWVNFGMGWRWRWFVLQDGVLSYYKIHGPDKIEVDPDIAAGNGSKVIGEESMRRLSRHLRSSRSISHPKPYGEVHLKVATIRASASDDKRFSIFTGTKRLQLRAQTREDRDMWVEALKAVKGMFPRISNSELLAPVDDCVVSTDRLRERLMEEGVNEAVIADCEEIMRNEFLGLQTQLKLLKQKHALLIDTLRRLEV